MVLNVVFLPFAFIDPSSQPSPSLQVGLQSLCTALCTGTHRYDTISPEALLLIAEPATTPIVGVYTPPALNPNERI